MKRQTANKKLLAILNEFVDNYPDLRFGQLMHVLDIVKQDADPTKIKNEFYMESRALLTRVKSRVKTLKGRK